MKSPYRRSLMLLLLLLLPWAALPSAQRQRRDDRPRLIVLVVIDQFREEYLLRFEPFFGDGGFRRLLTHGAAFTNCHYEHAPTVTAPGHATIATGATPAVHGIINNDWYDREMGQIVTSVSDPSRHVVGASSGRASSPHRLLGTTFADELRLSTNFRSKVITLSYKDRSAILLGGKLANLALWFDETSGSFITSDYYVSALPEWAARFNAARPADRYFGARWEKAFPEAAYAFAAPDDRPEETPLPGGSRTFPHHITGGLTQPGPAFYTAFTFTPFANEVLVELAKRAIEGEQLGRDEFPDLLAISFSTNDLVGHYFGPDSQEVVDLTLRTDRALASLLAYLDSRPDANYVLALTADHGVAPIPEYAARMKLGSRRISPTLVRQAIEEALSARFGEGPWIEPKALPLLSSGFVYLNREAIVRKQLDAAAVEQMAGEAALKVPGIARYYTRTQLLEGRFPTDLVGRRVAASFHPTRSPDVTLVPEPFAFISGGRTGTTHGSPYSYDAHVPLILFGRRIVPGIYRHTCTPADLAPTLAALLGIEIPAGATGRILQEAIRLPNASSVVLPQSSRKAQQQ
ncbi:MAG: alkaline phosphatase family protein [Blastocatellia bacterium]|nr:alkaline phosphatase family protein [Blastocatellia bacterium]MCS7157713.1 alkaline phosphatase family protein [Blastocatellia bacterium]MDW8167084.1 alkaline phosphatase family protein [Acidobacteriota bacterium]MDW8257188.1 alkaline phosphatase family protein [Acidobacteriota bacterium]